MHEKAPIRGDVAQDRGIAPAVGIAPGKLRAGAIGLVAALVVAILIVAGSRNLAHFEAALVGYTFATLFAAFGVAYRYAMWLQRPPTRMYWRRG